MQTLTWQEMLRSKGMLKMNLEYWKQFENSGKIEDYLSFKAYDSKESTGKNSRTGEQADAGIYKCDGDHIKADSRGGIRQTY